MSSGVEPVGVEGRGKGWYFPSPHPGDLGGRKRVAPSLSPGASRGPKSTKIPFRGAWGSLSPGKRCLSSPSLLRAPLRASPALTTWKSPLENFKYLKAAAQRPGKSGCFSVPRRLLRGGAGLWLMFGSWHGFPWAWSCRSQRRAPRRAAGLSAVGTE